jgi:hypothetical protein
MLGYDKCVIVPRVQVAYKLNVFLEKRNRFNLDYFQPQEDENISFNPLPESQSCEPLKGMKKSKKLKSEVVLNKHNEKYNIASYNQVFQNLKIFSCCFST